MLTKMIPASVKSRLEAKIQKVTNQSPVPPHRLPLCALNFRPHHKNEEAYVLPKPQIDSCEKCDLGLPIPPKELWLRYGQSKEEYLLLGEVHIKDMLEIVNQSDFALDKGHRVLDFGCGAGRMIRYFKELAETGEIWGTDISAEHMYWCAGHLCPPFHFATTTMIPHLPFADGYFDFIYAASVFTHIAELADAWMSELSRILSARGRIFITIQDKHSISLLEPEYIEKQLPDVIQATGQNRASQRTYSKKINANKVYQNGKSSDFARMVIVFGHDYYVFYDINYFCKNVCSSLEVLSVTKEAQGFQTGVVLKKKT